MSCRSPTGISSLKKQKAVPLGNRYFIWRRLWLGLAIFGRSLGCVYLTKRSTKCERTSGAELNFGVISQEEK
jgi:hypothetical protein